MAKSRRSPRKLGRGREGDGRAKKKRKKAKTHAIIQTTIRTRVRVEDVPTIKDASKWIEYVNDKVHSHEELVAVSIRVDNCDRFEMSGPCKERSEDDCDY